MEFTDRLIAIMNHYGYNKNSFSVAVGASNNSVIGRLVNERNRRPSFDLIELILKKFPAINPTWLLIGEGDMFINRPDYLPSARDRVKKVSEALKLSIFKIASAAGKTSQEVIQMLESNDEPDLDFLVRLAKSIPVINEKWLIYNEGTMFKEGFSSASLIPVYEDIPVGITPDSVKNNQPIFTMYSSRITDTQKDVVFGTRNNSGDFPPLINIGDYILIKCCSVEDIIPSDIIFVSTTKRNYVKRMARTSSAKATTISLMDSQGLTYDIDKESITCIGLIVSVIRIIY